MHRLDGLGRYDPGNRVPWLQYDGPFICSGRLLNKHARRKKLEEKRRRGSGGQVAACTPIT